MIIRPISNSGEADLAYAIEAQCYPPEAAASREAFHRRYQQFGDFFYVAEEGGELAGVANGIRMAHDRIEDEGLKQLEGSDPNGPYFCLLTVAVAPDFRRRGIGHSLVRAIVQQARGQRLAAVLLMSEAHLLPFYERLGFRYVKPSASAHGGIAWHEMRLEL